MKHIDLQLSMPFVLLQDGLDRTWSHEVASYQDDMAGVVEQQQAVDEALVEEVAGNIGELEDPEGVRVHVGRFCTALHG
jgi:hypothetical protein